MLLLLLLTFKILYSHNAYNFLLLRYFPVFSQVYLNRLNILLNL